MSGKERRTSCLLGGIHADLWLGNIVLEGKQAMSVSQSVSQSVSHVRADGRSIPVPHPFLRIMTTLPVCPSS